MNCVIKYCLFLIIFFGSLIGKAELPPFLKEENNTWVDSLMNSMSLEEKIGQLFMIAAYSNRDETHYKQIESYIKQYKVGGLIFFQGTPEKQAELTNRYQAISKIPLAIGFDGEWGLSMRLKNTINYPKQLMLGAIEDNQLIYDMGAEFARQMKRIGIHINFAPVIDVNNNPNNPVINDRAFGDNKYNVTLKAKAYMKGMQDHNILACGKHFPGHGDTDVDSHFGMPILNHSKERLEQIELYPFRALIRNGVGSIMVAHMNVTALDNTPNLPSTLSKKVIQDKLKTEMGFKGLVFTDALNMKGVATNYPSGIAEVKALQAGNDVMLFSENVDAAIKGIYDAVKKGTITEARINESVRKILLAKYWFGLHQYQPINLTAIAEDINNEYAQLLNMQLIQHAITVVEDKKYQIPIVDVSEKIAHIAIGSGKNNMFANRLDDYTAIDHFYISKSESMSTINLTLNKLTKYKTIIVELNDMSRYASKNYGLSYNQIEAVNLINQTHNSITVIFGSPYSLKNFQNLNSILLAYNEDSITQDITAQILFGARAGTGTLPVSVGKFQYSTGMCTQANLRLAYGLPLEAGIDKKTLQQIDVLAKDAISTGATPSMQIIAAKNGIVFYRKSFGTPTYTSSINIDNNDLYDIASITKVSATLPVIMRMAEDKKIDINQPIGNYYRYSDSCNKNQLIIKDILTHQSGLAAWIPFYKKTIDSLGFADTTWYHTSLSTNYPIKITENLFLRKDFKDSIYNRIYLSELNNTKYVYSDLGFYLLKDVIENMYKDSLQKLAARYLWKPLGMNNTLYNPLSVGINKNHIVPTEQEKGFRNTLLQGTVHDQGAALLGGIAGHAGVFSTANDLAKYFQMLLNKGTYGGTRFYMPSIISQFTTQQYSNNRRALGFDKPASNGDGPTCKQASANSFGHTGFTGCIAWADPDYNLLFVVLSNRIHPSAENKKFINQNIRPKIQEVLYQSILKQNKSTYIKE